MNSINFTARLVSSPTIQQRNFISWKPYGVSIVELDSAHSDDIRALEEVSDNWCKNGGKYADDIFLSAIPELKSSCITGIKDHFYALTTQKKNFEKIDPYDILGLMLFQEKNDNTNEIALLEVNPSTSKSKNNIVRKYKEVGKALVEFVKSKFSHRDIDVLSDHKAIDFYKKVGFQQKSRNIDILCWRALK